MLALSIMSHAAQAMMINMPGFQVSAYAKKHGIPVRLINEVVEQLVAAQLLAEVSAGDGSYVLLKVPDSIRVKDVMRVIIQAGTVAFHHAPFKSARRVFIPAQRSFFSLALAAVIAGLSLVVKTGAVVEGDHVDE